MSKKNSHWLSRRSGRSFIATLLALSLMLVTTLSAFASTVNISDRAGVLDANRVRNAGMSLPNRLDIYTTSNFNNSTTAFNQEAIRSIPNPSTIVMAISTNLHYVSIVGGHNVGLSKSQYTDAANSFINSYRSNHDYTGATIAAIDSLRNLLGGSGFTGPVSGGSAFGGGVFCCIGLLVIAGIALFAFVRRRSGGGFFNRRGYGPTYNQPYNQPGYPPNYGPGYPPNQGGMNPWAAGGLGAAAGGLLGYELGKEAGERDRDNDGGNFGGGDFGGGAGGSFGGDDGGFGGGGDFGGGAGGSFGGDGGGFGGDGGGFGGDNNSGGGDFGGGAGGNF